MAERECWLCSTKQDKLRRLPNGVKVCEECYTDRNPLKMLGGHWQMYNHRVKIFNAETGKEEVIQKPRVRMDKAEKRLYNHK